MSASMRDIREVFGIEPVQFREGLAKFLGKTKDLDTRMSADVT